MGWDSPHGGGAAHRGESVVGRGEWRGGKHGRGEDSSGVEKGSEEGAPCDTPHPSACRRLSSPPALTLACSRSHGVGERGDSHPRHAWGRVATSVCRRQPWDTDGSLDMGHP